MKLAFRKNVRFLLDGSDFQTLGDEYSWQNPVYTMRTFPERLKTQKGERAFSVWTGGWLGVSMKQVEDFNRFHDEWYLNDIISK